MNSTYTKEQILHALREGGADAVRQLVDPRPTQGITKDLITEASRDTGNGTVSRAIKLYYLHPAACDLDREVIDLRGEVSTTSHDGWLSICRWNHEGYYVEGRYIHKAYQL